MFELFVEFMALSLVQEPVFVLVIDGFNNGLALCQRVLVIVIVIVLGSVALGEIEYFRFCALREKARSCVRVAQRSNQMADRCKWRARIASVA